MPEGPELHLASCYINTACAGLVFSGKVEKSEVSKNPAVPFESDEYLISATSRGKEVKLSLSPVKEEDGGGGAREPMDIVFRFGMSGYFTLSPAAQLPKHAHLRFYTRESPRRALCFVDTRRFGSWEALGTWQPERGPCVMLEYAKFRENVLSNLAEKAFDRPICEVLINQKYFNGIGNYLRAEILYRLKIPPFVKARTVLDPLLLQNQDAGLTLSKKVKVKKKNPDLLELCHSVPMEVIHLGGKGYDPTHRGDPSVFENWLRCYCVPGMKSLRDGNGRTIWFQGEPGPLGPKAAKSKKKRRGVKADPEAPRPKVIKSETQQDSKAARTRADRTGKDQKGKLSKKIAREPELRAGVKREKQVNLKTRKREPPSQERPDDNPPVRERKRQPRRKLEISSVSQDASGNNPPPTKKLPRARRNVDPSGSNPPPSTARETAKPAGSGSRARRPRRKNIV
ncbi:endonuclease 8-like 1 isoform X2 [Rhinatrema bivittatum]|uniref:endonuclease 8-like 1 isoform X2 n=1 Tax=Rhinatrema bivittatum TaxID=194408 RepID=UPI001127BE3E|nr:endonuclease 8-like 1 isoform X2 [Rhinatrema bivittatum]